MLETGGFNPTGAVLLLVGTVLLALAEPGQLASIVDRVSRGLSVTEQSAAPNGNLALLGMLLLAAALGTLLRSRRWC